MCGRGRPGLAHRGSCPHGSGAARHGRPVPGPQPAPHAGNALLHRLHLRQHGPAQGFPASPSLMGRDLPHHPADLRPGGRRPRAGPRADVALALPVRRTAGTLERWRHLAAEPLLGRPNPDHAGRRQLPGHGQRAQPAADAANGRTPASDRSHPAAEAAADQRRTLGPREHRAASGTVSTGTHHHLLWRLGNQLRKLDAGHTRRPAPGGRPPLRQRAGPHRPGRHPAPATASMEQAVPRHSHHPQLQPPFRSRFRPSRHPPVFPHLPPHRLLRSPPRPPPPTRHRPPRRRTTPIPQPAPSPASSGSAAPCCSSTT